jgi:hypothetical protein
LDAPVVASVRVSAWALPRAAERALVQLLALAPLDVAGEPALVRLLASVPLRVAEERALARLPVSE